MIFYQCIGHKYIRANLIAPSDIFLIAFNILNFFQMLPLFDFNQFGTQHFHGNFPVLVLAPLILTGHNHAGGNMGNPDRRFGFIDMLATSPTGTIGINFQIFFPDLHSRIVIYFRHNLQRGKRGMPPARCVKGRYPDHSMNPRLRFEITVGIHSFYQYRGAFHACFLSVEDIENFHFKPMPFRPAGIHP